MLRIFSIFINQNKQTHFLLYFAHFTPSRRLTAQIISSPLKSSHSRLNHLIPSQIVTSHPKSYLLSNCHFPFQILSPLKLSLPLPNHIPSQIVTSPSKSYPLSNRHIPSQIIYPLKSPLPLPNHIPSHLSHPIQPFFLFIMSDLSSPKFKWQFLNQKSLFSQSVLEVFSSRRHGNLLWWHFCACIMKTHAYIWPPHKLFYLRDFLTFVKILVNRLGRVFATPPE